MEEEQTETIEDEKALEAYHTFIDDLLAMREGILKFFVSEDYWGSRQENAHFKSLTGSLNENQKSVLLELLLKVRRAGIHDVLSYLNKYKLTTEEGVELPEMPYGNMLHAEWAAHIVGQRWEDYGE